MRPNSFGIAVWMTIGLLVVLLASFVNALTWVLVGLFMTALYPFWNGVVVPLYVIADRMDRLERLEAAREAAES